MGLEWSKEVKLTDEQFEIALCAYKRNLTNGDDTLDPYVVKARQLGVTRFEAKRLIHEEIANTSIWQFED